MADGSYERREQREMELKRFAKIILEARRKTQNRQTCNDKENKSNENGAYS